MRVIQLALIVLFVVYVAHSVEHHKFKRCEQNPFCKRNRDLQHGRVTPYVVVKDSVQITQKGVDFNVVDKSSGQMFEGFLYCYNGGILRWRLKEKEPIFLRFEPNDLVQNSLLGDPLAPVSVTRNDKKTEDTVVFTSDTGMGNVIIHLEPFELTVKGRDGQNVLRVNEHHLFNYEHTRKYVPSTPVPEAPKTNWLQSAKDFLTGEAEDQEEETEGDTQVEIPVPETPEPTPEPTPSDEWEETFDGQTDKKLHGPTSIGCDVSFVGATHLYGLPEHASSLALGNTRDSSNGNGIDEPYRLFNLDVFEYELNNHMALYGSIPFILAHSRHGSTGILWNSVSETIVDISQSAASRWGSGPGQREAHFISESGNVDMFLVLGPTPKDVLSQYARITGYPALPPLFSIAYHQCRWNYKDEADVASVDEGFDEHDIPMDVLWLDIEHTDGKRYMTWDKPLFPNPAEMQKKLSDKGRKMVTIVDPHIKRDSGYTVHSLAESNGYYVKNSDGNVFEGWCWPGSSSWIDFFNPAARAFWADRLSLDNYEGSTESLFIWNDMNEPSVFNSPEITMPRNNLHYGGMEHREVHNMYGTLVHEATANALVRRSGGMSRPFVLSRAFSQGSQRHGAIWTGDNTADWGHLAMAQPMLLSVSVAGLPFAGSDVGGFFGNPDDELMVRWYQAASYHPFFRAHAHLDTKRREPWLFDDEHKGLIKTAITRRYALLPYWYTLFHEASVSGVPMMRPIWMEFPNDVRTFDTQDTFMIGSALLVQPITEMLAKQATVYLPGSDPWYDYETWKTVRGPDLAVQTTLSTVPVYIRGGHVIPRKDRIRRSSSQMVNDPYTLIVAPDAGNRASGEIYVDDGHSFEYQNGNFMRRVFAFENGVLKCSGDDTTYRDTTVVERVIILGQITSPKSITIGSQILEFEHDLVGQRVVIRKPGVAMRDEWAIKVE